MKGLNNGLTPVFTAHNRLIYCLAFTRKNIHRDVKVRYLGLCCFLVLFISSFVFSCLSVLLVLCLVSGFDHYIFINPILEQRKQGKENNKSRYKTGIHLPFHIPQSFPQCSVCSPVP